MNGCSGLPRTFVTRPSSTVTTIEHVSGQSCGQAPRVCDPESVTVMAMAFRSEGAMLGTPSGRRGDDGGGRSPHRPGRATMGGHDRQPAAGPARARIGTATRHPRARRHPARIGTATRHAARAARPARIGTATRHARARHRPARAARPDRSG